MFKWNVRWEEGLIWQPLNAGLPKIFSLRIQQLLQKNHVLKNHVSQRPFVQNGIGDWKIKHSPKAGKTNISPAGRALPPPPPRYSDHLATTQGSVNAPVGAPKGSWAPKRSRGGAGGAGAAVAGLGGTARDNGTLTPRKHRKRRSHAMAGEPSRPAEPPRR